MTSVDSLAASNRDQLADSVLAALGRPSENRRPWGAIFTVVVSVLSFGLLPLLVILRRHTRQADCEQQSLWHLAEWVRTRAGYPDSQRLMDAAGRPGPIRPLLGIAGAALLLAGACLALTAAVPPGRPGLPGVIDTTFGYLHQRATGRATAAAGRLFAIWTGCLTLASAALYMQMQWHARRVRRFVDVFNDFAAREGISALKPPGIGLGLRPGFVAAMILMLAAGAPWDIPVLLTAGLYRTHCYNGRVLRQRLAERLRGMLQNRHPRTPVPRPIWSNPRCPSPLCRAQLPREATYCPRCGSRCESLDLVA